MAIAVDTTHKLGPLKMFYAKKNIPLPELELLPGKQLPEPARTLLFHRQDMTSKLQAFVEDEIVIDVLQKQIYDSSLHREVVLQRQNDRLPVEYGAIQIHYANLPEEAQRQVLESKKPLGAILNDFEIPFRSCPGCFFRTEPDPVMEAALQLDGDAPLFGRCNVLLYENGQLLANVVEILPPLERMKGLKENQRS